MTFIQIDNVKLRKLAISLYNDDEGINEKAHEELSDLLVETGNDDIPHVVDATDGRFYISSEIAKELLEKE